MANNKPIPSPFEQGDREDHFISDLQELCEKYGYNNHMCFYAEPDENGAHWHVIAHNITDGLIEVIEEAAESLRDEFGDNA